MPKIGIVGIRGGWSSEELANAVERKTGYCLLIEPDRISLDLSTGSAWFEGTDISKLDALIIKKAGGRYCPLLLDRLELLRFLREQGLKIFSDPYKIMRVLDRLSCTVTLRSAGIPMPETTITESTAEARRAVEKYGEAVFKPLYSTKARGMELICDGPDAAGRIEDFSENFGMMYIQKKMDIGGQDLGIVFLGGEYLTTYARCGDGSSWNTTTRSGGKYQPYTPSAKTIALAQKAQDLFGLDFTCVDVAESGGNGPIVFEVSAFGGFRGIQTASGMDAADLYADYVLKKL